MDDFAAAAGAEDRPHFQEQVEGRPHLVRSEFGEAFGTVAALDQEGAPGGHARELRPEMHDIGDLREWRGGGATGLDPAQGAVRSEEHTSELQSLMRISYAVLFLTKKRHY